MESPFNIYMSDADEETQPTLKSHKIAGYKVKMHVNNNIYPTDIMLDNELESTFIADHIYLCIYRIVVKPNTTPFLQYLLHREKHDELSFHGCNGGNLQTAHSLYDDVVGYKHLAKSHYRGVHKEGGELFVFYHYIEPRLNMGVDVIENPHNTNWYWCIMDEICNWRKVGTLTVNPTVVKLFYSKSELIYLYDRKFDRLEVPVVAYNDSDDAYTIYMFGVDYGEKNGMYGPYFYFKQKPTKTGVRCALFLGHMKVLLNHPRDPVDGSEIAKKMRDDIDTREQFSYKAKLVDYDGLWADNYDSLYVGRVKMDNGELFKTEPIYVVKEWSQYIPLSI